MSLPTKKLSFEIVDITKMSEQERLAFLTGKSLQGILKGEPETAKEHEQFIINLIYIMEHRKMIEEEEKTTG